MSVSGVVRMHGVGGLAGAPFERVGGLTPDAATRAFVEAKRAQRASWGAIAVMLGCSAHDLRRTFDGGYAGGDQIPSRAPRPPAKRATGPGRDRQVDDRRVNPVGHSATLLRALSAHGQLTLIAAIEATGFEAGRLFHVAGMLRTKGQIEGGAVEGWTLSARGRATVREWGREDG